MSAENKFTCKQCGAQVDVVDGKVTKRDCGHDEAGVIADVSAHAYGVSSLNRETPTSCD